MPCVGLTLVTTGAMMLFSFLCRTDGRALTGGESARARGIGIHRVPCGALTQRDDRAETFVPARGRWIR
ncbi:hypothetical protein GCM10009548_52060 [Streptomyces malaysiensis subsp. malaysiensis]